MSNGRAGYRTESYLNTVAVPRLRDVDVLDPAVARAARANLSDGGMSDVVAVGVAMVRIMLLVEAQVWLTLGATTGYFVASADRALEFTHPLHDAGRGALADALRLGEIQGVALTPDLDPQAMSLALGISSFVGAPGREYLRQLCFATNLRSSMTGLSPDLILQELWSDSLVGTPAGWRRIPARLEKHAGLWVEPEPQMDDPVREQGQAPPQDTVDTPGAPVLEEPVLTAPRPRVVEQLSGSARSRFIIEPLRSGFGHTFANALRAALLRSDEALVIVSLSVRVEQITDADRVVIEIATTSKVAPRDALALASKELQSRFGLAWELSPDADGGKLPRPTAGHAATGTRSLRIGELGFSRHVYNLLRRRGVHTVEQLVSRSEQDLRDVGLDRSSVEEVKERLRRRGLSLSAAAPALDEPTAIAEFEGFDESSD